MNKPAVYLGIDSSNYTSSVALIDENMNMVSQRKLLPVKEGERGLRQSDAVFLHVKQFPEIFDSLKLKDYDIKAIGVSVSPTLDEGSYMPCFMVGGCLASILGNACGCDVYEFSHQQGHIAAALISCDKLKLLENNFLAFHVSGGTTECVLASPDKEKIIKTEVVLRSLDLKAGQAIDRVGVKLGMKFPCGPALEKEALKSEKSFKVKPYVKNGDCSLSGLENKCEKMIKDGESIPDIAKFCFDFISEALKEMLIFLRAKNDGFPVVFSGGVMSNSIIRKNLSCFNNIYFASREMSSDNAVGIAKLTQLKSFSEREKYE